MKKKGEPMKGKLKEFEFGWNFRDIQSYFSPISLNFT